MPVMGSRNNDPWLSLLYFAWGVEAKCIVVTAVCLSVYIWLSLAAFQHYCTDPDVTCGNGSGCRLVVHCWADLQSVHGSPEREMSASVCMPYAWFYSCIFFVHLTGLLFFTDTCVNMFVVIYKQQHQFTSLSSVWLTCTSERCMLHLTVVGDESNINACQQQKRCGKCISLLPDCYWCLQKVNQTILCS